MGYKVEYPTIEEAKASAGEYQYALLYRISDRILLTAGMLHSEDWQECMEAVLFREDAAVHLLFEENRAVRISDDGEEDILVREYDLDNSILKMLKRSKGTLMIKQYLETDEDGQMMISLSRPAAIR